MFCLLNLQMYITHATLQQENDISVGLSGFDKNIKSIQSNHTYCKVYILIFMTKSMLYLLQSPYYNL